MFKGAPTCSAEESGRRRKRANERVAKGEFGTVVTSPEASEHAHIAARWPPSISRWRSLAVKHPELLAEWHPTRNEGLDPYAVSAGSTHQVWWRCARGHEWLASPRSRCTYGHGCNACYAQSRWRVPRERSLAAKHPELLAEWHPTRNGELDPYTIGAAAKRKVWWHCARCGHEWQTTPWLRHTEGTGCPLCGRRRASEYKTRVPRERSLAVKHPQLLAEWHPTRNEGLDPYTVGAGSEREVWWRCSRCGHEWLTSPKERKRGTGCPACARRLAGQRRAHVPRERSLALRAPALLADWHPTRNKGIDPYSVGVGSDRVVWWRCRCCGHEWRATPNQRRAGQRCPTCRVSPQAPQRSPRGHLVGQE
ncbi:MAG TPA: zinc-ribbon domain-containing protein [Solirubrobacteraceae bacterium]|nr:zinc-ribbon domain-containing protein [Solirubrobacteraceae bacterium]